MITGQTLEVGRRCSRGQWRHERRSHLRVRPGDAAWTDWRPPTASWARTGRVEGVLAYREQDARIVPFLYRPAARRGTLKVDGYLKRGKGRVELGRLEVPVGIGRGSGRGAA